MCVLLFDVFNGCSTSVKKINRLIWKNVKYLILRKTCVLKTWIFSEWKFEEKH